MHGISRLVEVKSLSVKLAWTLMITASMICGSFIIFKSANDFYRHDVITNIERESSEQATFPAVTVCMLDTGMKKIQIINDTIEGYSEYSPNMAHFNLSIIDFISECTFNGRQLFEEDVEFFEIMTRNQDSYSCVRFNGGPKYTHEVVHRRNKNQLELRLYDEIYDVVDGKSPSEELVKYYNLFYYHLFVGDNYLNSQLKISPIIVENCYDYIITIDKTDVEKKLPEPYNQCTDSVDESYRQTNCIEMCINKEFKDKYNCSVKSYYMIAGLEPCHDIRGINVSQAISRFYTDCLVECPKECETIKYTSQVMIETKKRYDEYNPSFDLNKSHEHYTSISFLLKDFSALKITQIPKMSSFDLIANIGGSFGFFVGISFLSFIEVFEFIIDICICLFV